METKGRYEGRYEWKGITVDEARERIDAMHFNIYEDCGYIQVCDMNGRGLEWSDELNNMVVDHVDYERIDGLLCYEICVEIKDYSKVKFCTENND